MYELGYNALYCSLKTSGWAFCKFLKLIHFLTSEVETVEYLILYKFQTGIFSHQVNVVVHLGPLPGMCKEGGNPKLTTDENKV